jgi:hypothetical protein
MLYQFNYLNKKSLLLKQNRFKVRVVYENEIEPAAFPIFGSANALK